MSPLTSLTGVRRLVRFTWRRDRFRLVIWVGVIVLVSGISAVSLLDVYPDQQAIDSYVNLFADNPALIVFAGPGNGFDAPNIGVILVNETQLWAAISVALMSIFMVNHQTRAEEESERTELVLAGVVGRHAPTAASIIVVTVAQIVVGVVLAFWFVLLGYPVVGSVALAAATAAVGLVFAGVTAVSAQLASSSRAAIGLSATLLAGAFVVRAVGDIGGNVMSWLSPFGWGFGMRAFADEQWWPLAVSVAVTVGLVALSFWLSTRRDLGSGLLPQRAGPERAAGWLTNPLGLALRLRRGSLIAWPVGLFLTGVTFGSIGDDIDQMLEDNPAMADFITLAGDATPTDAYFAVAITMLALITGGLAISVALGPRSEEGAGRADLVLAGPVRRARWAGSHVVIAVVGTIVSLLASGLGVGVGYAAIVGDTSQVPRLTAAALVTLPAVLAVLGATVALYGWFPRWALLAWGLLAFVGVVGYLGEVLQLPRWVRDLSPFERLPAVPAEDVTFVPLVVLTVIAGGLTTLGLWGLGRRDVDVH